MKIEFRTDPEASYMQPLVEAFLLEELPNVHDPGHARQRFGLDDAELENEDNIVS